MSQQKPRTSEVFVEIIREGKPPLRTTFDAYIYASISEVPRARLFVVTEEGERVYIAGDFAAMAASIAGYRRAHVVAAEVAS